MHLLLIFLGHGQPALMERRAIADGKSLDRFCPSRSVCEQMALVSEFAAPPPLSPAVLKEPWCCCETLTSDQFEAVAADQGTCEWMGLIPLLSSHILGVWLSVPLEEELQESI